MSQRLRLIDFRLSDGPAQCGVSPGDIVGCAKILNSAQERLRYDQAFGDEGPTGSYAEMVITVPREKPYITCPRGVNSLIAVDPCRTPVALQNQFSEYLQFGTGRLPKCERWQRGVGEWHQRSGHTRNHAVTFEDMTDPPQQITIVPENVNDCVPNSKTGTVPRVLVQGTCNGFPITTQDGPNTVQGEFVTITQPSVTTVNNFDQITGIQKDVTLGNIQIWQTDPWWGSGELLSVMEPGEKVAWYRRYYINGLLGGVPYNRCYRGSQMPGWQRKHCGNIQVFALARLDLIPAVVDSDYLLIQSLEALKLECMAGYMLGMQDAESKQQAAAYHQSAVSILIGQSYADEGKNSVAVNFSPFGEEEWGRRYNLTMQ